MDDVTESDRQMAAVAYAGGGFSPIIAALIWLTAKTEFVKEHGRRAFIAHIVIAIVVTMVVLITCGFGAPLIVVAWLWGFYEAMKVMKTDED